MEFSAQRVAALPRGALSFGAVGVMLASLITTALVPAVATAAAGTNPFATASIELEYDGTGRGTPSQTFINSVNGYSPADDTATDRVIASGDLAGYKLRINVEAGPKRDIDVTIDLPR